MKRQSAGTRTAEKHLRRKGPRKGFFHGKHYVDMSHIPMDDFEAYLPGKLRHRNVRGKHGKKPHRDSNCSSCKKPGHYAKGCPEKRRCFKCGKTDHVLADCP